ncbi:MAG: ABC transporter substrate-binding protein, partial [Anaerolineales bacterium]
LSLMILLSLVLVACGGGAVETVVVTEMVEGETVERVVTATPPPEEPMEDIGSIFILGPFRGPEAEAFESVISVFEEQNPDIDVIYSGTGEFETLITVRVEAGDPPDIAAFPQPGAVARFAEQGVLTPLWDEALAIYDEQYQPAWKDLSQVNGTPYGMFHRVNAKGWFWYNKPDWDEAGWEVPETWDDLLALLDEMAADGSRAPLCEGIESGAATGWKGTDWVENIMLRTQPVDVYDAWVSHELPFSSDEVSNAWEILGDVWFNEDWMFGGTEYIATTNFQDPAGLLFAAEGEEPQCWLHMQGSFVTNFFPDDVQDDLDTNVGVFAMPPIDTSLSPALEVGGDQYVVFQSNDRPEVRRFIEFLGTPESVQPWAELGGSLFPHVNQDISWYPTELEQNMAEAIVGAEQARFDGSDNMASEVNLAFWEGITNWVTGAELDTVLGDIDETLPE